MPLQPGNLTTSMAAPAYNYDTAIRERLSIINNQGTQATQFAQDQANEKAQAANAALVQKAQNEAEQSGYENQGADWTYKGPTDNSLRSRIVNYASKFQGTPYQWGGSKPGGFDCSGLVQYVYGKMGVNMPRVSQAQATVGHMTKNIGDLRPGDFVAWGNTPATAHHIAIYAGNGMVWEAPHKGAQVRLRRVSPKEAGIMGIQLSI